MTQTTPDRVFVGRASPFFLGMQWASLAVVAVAGLVAASAADVIRQQTGEGCVMADRPTDPVTVTLAAWTGPIDSDDPDANFKADVATYSLADPLATITNVARNLDLPVGAVARYVLAKWASGGAEGLLELGPSTVDRMREVVGDAEAAGTDEARLAAYGQLRSMLEWLGHGLDSPETTYPAGGGDPAGG